MNKFGGEILGLFGKLAAVVAAPFVVTACAMGAIPAVVIGLPAAAAAIAVAEIEDSLLK